MIRGDVIFADLDPTKDSEQGGNRPVIVVSRNAINRSSPVVVIVPLTKLAPNKKIYPSHHVIKKSTANGLKHDSIAKCEQIRAISKSRLTKKQGSLNIEDIKRINIALKIVLSIE